MTPDKDTLQSELNHLMADAANLEGAIKQRQEAIQRFTAEVEQHRGALAYNRQNAERLRGKLAELAQAAELPPAPPA